MVGAAGAVCGTSQREDDGANRTSGRFEDAVIGGHDAIGIIEKVLGVLQSPLAERRVNVDCHSAAWAGSNELRCALIAGPSWR